MEKKNKNERDMMQTVFNTGYWLQKNNPSLLYRVECMNHDPKYRKTLEAGKAEAIKEKEHEKRSKKIAEIGKRFEKEKGKDEFER